MNTTVENKSGWQLLATASLFLVLTAFLGDQAIGQLVDQSQQDWAPVSSANATDTSEHPNCA